MQILIDNGYKRYPMNNDTLYPHGTVLFAKEYEAHYATINLFFYPSGSVECEVISNIIGIGKMAKIHLWSFQQSEIPDYLPKFEKVVQHLIAISNDL